MKVDGAPEKFEDTILEGFGSRMRQLIEERKKELKRSICEEIDRVAEEELAQTVLRVSRWARVTVRDDVMTIEIHKPGVKKEETT